MIFILWIKNDDVFFLLQKIQLTLRANCTKFKRIYTCTPGAQSCVYLPILLTKQIFHVIHHNRRLQYISASFISKTYHFIEEFFFSPKNVAILIFFFFVDCKRTYALASRLFFSISSINIIALNHSKRVNPLKDSCCIFFHR